MRAVIYARCSTEEASQQEALAAQVAEAEACVTQKGWILVDRYVESRSGTSTRGRGEYNRLYGDLLTEKFQVIVIKSQDRLMRNTKDWYLFVDRLSRAGKQLYLYLEGKFYSPEDSLLTGIKAILAEDYSRELSKKINHAHQKRQKSGGAVILTNQTYGYRKRQDKEVELVEEEAEGKRRMYELCAAGYGCRRISRILAEEGYTNRQGRPFSDSSICRMIKNPLHKGTAVMHRTHYDFTTKQTYQVAAEEQYCYPGRVPALVSEQLWEAANAALQERRAKGGAGAEHRGRNPGKGLFSGLLFCGLCGAPYYRVSRKKRKAEERLYEWKCSTCLARGRSACTNVTLPEGQLLEFLYGQAAELAKEERAQLAAELSEAVKKLLPGAEEENRRRALFSYIEETGIKKAALLLWKEQLQEIRVYPERLAIQKREEPCGKGSLWELQTGCLFSREARRQEEERRLCALIQKRPGLTAEEMAEKLQLPPGAVRYRLGCLKKAGRAAFVGKGGRGHWEVKN